MRKVIYSEYKTDGENTSGTVFIPYLVEMGEAIFHQWGLNAFESGGPNTTSAIIELEDGTVKNIPAEHIRFISGELDQVTVEGSPVKIELK